MSTSSIKIGDFVIYHNMPSFPPTPLRVIQISNSEITVEGKNNFKITSHVRNFQKI